MGQARRRGRRGARLDRRQAAELAALVAAGRPLAGEGVVRPLEVLEPLAGLEGLEGPVGLAEVSQNYLGGIR